MKKQNRYLRIIIIAFLSSAIYYVLYIYNFNDRADKNFYMQSFCGKITDIKTDIREFKSIKLNNDEEWYHLSVFFNYKDCNCTIEIGDSIVKEKETYQILLYKKEKVFRSYYIPPR